MHIGRDPKKQPVDSVISSSLTAWILSFDTWILFINSWSLTSFGDLCKYRNKCPLSNCGQLFSYFLSLAGCSDGSLKKHIHLHFLFHNFICYSHCSLIDSFEKSVFDAYTAYINYPKRHEITFFYIKLFYLTISYNSSCSNSFLLAIWLHYAPSCASLTASLVANVLCIVCQTES